MMSVSALFAALLICFPLTVFAQSGSVSGVVIDSDTGQPLENARISLQTGAETTSDEYGNYRFINVPAGSNTLNIRMLGYVPQSIQISVQNGNQSVEEVRLHGDFPEGDRILHKGRLQGQARSLTQQNESVNFKTVISAQVMDAFGDRTLEDAVSRISGTQPGRYGGVNLRGTGFHQFHVTLDGRRMASTGFGDRSVDLSGISSDMAHQIEIIRVLTPDMHAEGLGGAINIRTRKPIGERSAGAYGGVGAHPTYFKYGGTGTRTGVSYSEAVREDLQVGVNLNYQREHFGWESLNVDYDAADFGDGRTDVIRRVSPGLHSSLQGRFGGGVQMNYLPDERTLIHLNGFYNNNSGILDVHRNYWDTGGDWIRPDSSGAVGEMGRYGYDARRQDLNMNQYTIQAGARHWFDLFDLEYSVNWSSANARQEQYLFPFMRQGLNFSINTEEFSRPTMRPQDAVLKRDGTIDYRVIRFQQLERVINDQKDDTFSGNIDLEIPLGIVSFKAGSSAILNNKKGYYRQTSYAYSGSLDLYRFRMIPLGDINIFNEDAYYIPWIIDTENASSFLEYNTPAFSKNENQELRNSEIWNYNHSESIYAGYGMGTVRFGSVQVLGGVRVEHTMANYEGRDADFDESGAWTGTQIVDTDRQYTHFFPNAQVLFRPLESTNIRLAWSQSIGRPEYNRLSPFMLTNRQDSVLFRGNPNLNPVMSDNLDLLVDHYFSGVGKIGIGAFYKQLSDFIYERSRIIADGEYAGFTDRSFENSDDQATLYGVEVSWQQNLSFLPGILGNLGTHVNYTWSQSELEVSARPDETLSLPGHSPHVVNAALNFYRGRIFSQVTWHWMAESLVSLSETPVWAPSISNSEQVYLDRYDSGISDLSVSFGFRISEHFRFWADASNLLRNERVIYDHTQSAYPRETDLSRGFVFRSGIRYNL